MQYRSLKFFFRRSPTEIAVFCAHGGNIKLTIGLDGLAVICSICRATMGTGALMTLRAILVSTLAPL